MAAATDNPKLKRLDVDEVLQMARQIKKLEESSNKSGLAARREVIRHWADKNLATVLEELVAARSVADTGAALVEAREHSAAAYDVEEQVDAVSKLLDCERILARRVESYREEWLSERD